MSSGNRMRTLVPFFLPGDGDIVNEALHSFDDLVLTSGQTQSQNSSPSSSSSRADVKSPSRSLHPCAQSESSIISVPVREWDHSEGFFRDGVRLIQDVRRPHSLPIPSVKVASVPTPSFVVTPVKASPQRRSPSSPPCPSSRLLTPAVIRQSCRRSRPVINSDLSSPSTLPPRYFASVSASQITTPPPKSSSMSYLSSTPASAQCSPVPPSRSTDFSSVSMPAIPSPNVSTPRNINSTPNQHRALPSERRKSRRRQSSPDGPSRSYAGFSFEAASPPPARLPLPAFKRSSSVVTLSDSCEEEHRLEGDQTTVPLRNILRV